MRKRIYRLAAYMLLLVWSTGCSRVDGLAGRGTGIEQGENYDWLPQKMSNSEIYLYDKYDQRIITYDLNQHKVMQRNDTLNYLQFEFNDLTSGIYTTGHSIENNYKIIKIGQEEIDTLYEADQMDALFPLAYKSSENMIFLKCTYQDNGSELYEERVICKFNEKTATLTEITSTKGMRITNGTIIGETLYFTEYNADTDRYVLYMFGIACNEQPTMLSNDLSAGELYNNHGELWVSDDSKIYSYQNDAIYFLKKVLNYFYSDKLFQIDISANGNLELFVTNVNTQKLEADIEGVIDVRISDGKIRVYTDKEVIEL